MLGCAKCLHFLRNDWSFHATVKGTDAAAYLLPRAVRRSSPARQSSVRRSRGTTVGCQGTGPCRRASGWNSPVRTAAIAAASESRPHDGCQQPCPVCQTDSNYNYRMHCTYRNSFHCSLINTWPIFLNFGTHSVTFERVMLDTSFFSLLDRPWQVLHNGLWMTQYFSLFQQWDRYPCSTECISCYNSNQHTHSATYIHILPDSKLSVSTCEFMSRQKLNFAYFFKKLQKMKQKLDVHWSPTTCSSHVKFKIQDTWSREIMLTKIKRPTTANPISPFDVS